jgi:hypothetical protein
MAPRLASVARDCSVSREARRPTSGSAVMITLRELLVPAVVSVLLTGCGRSAGTPPKIAEKADVIVTLDGKRHACVVALYNEPNGSAIPCGDVVAFFKDELRLPSGSIYDIRTGADADEAQIAPVAASLKSAGYRFIGGRQIPFAN